MDKFSQSESKFLYVNEELVKLIKWFDINLVLDVGANSGQYAKELYKAGYDGNVISFEPLSSAYAQLEAESKTYKNWDIAERCALGEEDSYLSLNIAGNSQSSSLLPMLKAHELAAPHSKYISKEVVEVKRLDSLIENKLVSEKRTFLKLDVQGFEQNVLKGSTMLINEIVGLQIELDLVPLYEGNLLFEDMFKLIKNMGFTLFRIKPGFSDSNSGRMLQMDGIFFRKNHESTVM